MLLQVSAVWIYGRDLLEPINEPLDNLHTLHERVILISHLTPPSSEAPV